MTRTLYERIGGDGAVRATVVKMYEKILSDDDLAPFFEDIDVDKLRLSQTAFVTYAFGGPNHYTGKSLRNAHRNAVEHGINNLHFDKVAKHLHDAMQELDVPKELIKEALTIVESTRNDVLCK